MHRVQTKLVLFYYVLLLIYWTQKGWRSRCGFSKVVALYIFKIVMEVENDSFSCIWPQQEVLWHLVFNFSWLKMNLFTPKFEHFILKFWTLQLCSIRILFSQPIGIYVKPIIPSRMSVDRLQSLSIAFILFDDRLFSGGLMLLGRSRVGSIDLVLSRSVPATLVRPFICIEIQRNSVKIKTNVVFFSIW